MTTPSAIHRYGLISDTHGVVHPDVFRIFDGVDAIFHAGDVCGENVMSDLQAIAPVYAVMGNCDLASEDLPIRRSVEMPFGIVGIAHGHLYAARIEDRVKQLVAAFKAPRLRLVLTGHSHVALHQLVDGVLVINPGAACRPRPGTVAGLATLLWDPAGDKLSVEFLELNWANVPRGR